MKILLVCSTSFYDRIPPIAEYLTNKGFTVIMPNCYDEPVTNEDNKKMTEDEYVKFFQQMYLDSRNNVGNVDAILVLNYTKVKNNEEYPNYIGASTFLEMYEACMQNKKIYILNDYPDNMLLDEIKGFHPTVLKGNLDLIK